MGDVPVVVRANGIRALGEVGTARAVAASASSWLAQLPAALGSVLLK